MTTRRQNTGQSGGSRNRFAVVIPLYNHAGRIGGVVEKALALGVPVIVVDDGSSDGSHRRVCANAALTLLRHPTNRGKGQALMTGMTAAAGMADWAVTFDADGQHDPADARRLMAAAAADPRRPIIVGRREGMRGAQAHWTSRYGRSFSNFWVAVSGGHRTADSQSGFRVYPLPESLHLNVRSGGYQFEIEVLVKARWKGIPLVEAPVSVSYRPDGGRVSHFRPFVDFVRNSRTFTRLIVQRMFLPATLRRRLASAANRCGCHRHVNLSTAL
jgi:glycosyltransferase involved in cell wall biosynthesis